MSDFAFRYSCNNQIRDAGWKLREKIQKNQHNPILTSRGVAVGCGE